MIFSSHGAVHSLSVVTVPPYTLLRPMRPLQGREARGFRSLLSRCCRRCRFSCSPSSRFRILYTARQKMGTARPSRQVWHASHGIVFAGDSQAAHPRLPPMRHHSASVAVFQEREPLPAFADGLRCGPVSTKSAGNMLGQPISSSTSSTTAHTGSISLRETATAIVPSNTVAAPTTNTAVAVVNDPAEDAQAVVTATEETKPPDHATLNPPFTPLEFKIPVEAFRKAKQAAEGTPESFWSYSLYRGPGTEDNPEGKIKVHYCTSLNTTERVLQQYFVHEKVLGFDLEWSPSATKFSGARKNVSVVQLASPSRIGLFHIAMYPPKTQELVAPSLKKIMEDPEITKAGVWIKGDSSRLNSYLGITPRGTFELSHLYRLVKYSASREYNLINKHLVSLARQVQDCLDLPMFKGEDVRTSDWSKPLNMSQIIYSSSDAYAAVQLYAILDHQRQKLDPTPPLPAHAELNLPIQRAEGLPETAPIEEQEPDAETAACEAAAGEDTPPITAEAYAKLCQTLNNSVSLESEAEPSTSAGDFSDPVLPVTPQQQQGPESKPSNTASTSKPTPKEKEKDPRVTEATLWASQYRLAHPRTRATPSSLRAYYLWQKNADLSPAAVAALLRDPPLQTMTVVNYILEGIRLGGKDGLLPFNKQRLREEVLTLIPADVLRGRYRSVLKACEASEQRTEEGA